VSICSYGNVTTTTRGIKRASICNQSDLAGNVTLTAIGGQSVYTSA